MNGMGQVPIDAEIDVVTVRQTVRERARALGFGLTDVTRVVTAASELARNIAVFAGSGLMRWCVLDRGGHVGIELIFEDQGPGITDVEQAMVVGYSTIGVLGMGLPGAKRLMDEMEIQSVVGMGTTVTVRKWLRRS